MRITTSETGPGGNTGWQEFSHKMPDDLGEGGGRGYYLACEITGYWDYEQPSFLLIDDIVVCRETFEGDIYRDCHVDFRDFAIFTEMMEWSHDERSYYDFNEDGVVDFLDIAEFADNWLEGKR